MALRAEAGADDAESVGTTQPFISRGVRRLEHLLQRIERSAFLDRLGEIIGTAFVKVVRPGPFKEFISGSWLAHPLHPVLTDLPIGAWTSAFVLDLLPDEDTARAADAMIGMGIVTALPTAVSGLGDLADVTESDQRTVGTLHMLGNVASIALYGGAYLARTRGHRGAGKALSRLGAAAVTGSAFLGGHLAFRKGIGVDQTAFQQRFDRWTMVLPERELPDDEPRRVMVNGVDVLLLRKKGRIYAIADRCSHRGGPLHEGEILDGEVECPWHQSVFSLEDGGVVRGPASAPQPAYDVRTTDGRIEIRSAKR